MGRRGDPLLARARGAGLYVLDLGGETLPRWLQVGIFVVWIVLLAGISVLLYSRSLREQCRVWLAEQPNPVVQAFSWRERVPA